MSRGVESLVNLLRRERAKIRAVQAPQKDPEIEARVARAMGIREGTSLRVLKLDIPGVGYPWSAPRTLVEGLQKRMVNLVHWERINIRGELAAKPSRRIKKHQGRLLEI